MEQYLKEQYNVQEIRYLKSEEDIIPYITEDCYEFFDCGQGYYEDEVEIIILLNEKFYKVNITAEIGSSKQDRGDRLYFVERVETVTYEEIEKPVYKQPEYVLINFKFEDVEKVEKLLNENNIKHIKL